MTKLGDYYADLQERVKDSADEFEPSDRSREKAFTEHILAQMVHQDVLDNFDLHDYEKQRYALHAGGFSDDGTTVYLVGSSYLEAGTPQRVLKADVDDLRQRVKNFLGGALKGFHEKLPHGPARDFALEIATQREEIGRARLFLIFDRIGKDYRYEEESIEGIPTKTEFWDLERISSDLSPDKGPERVDIDVQEFGAEVKLLEGGQVDGLYRSFLAVVPGDFIADIYAQKGSSLLERNVRSFLQLRTDINKGIYRTIEKEPQMFLTYNNGISGTASRLVIKDTPEGQFLTRIEDFQVVNGGQTTATLHRAKSRGLSLKDIRVQVKLTEVLSKDKLDEVVPNISRSSNTQNPVQEADFSANESFHRIIERISRNTIVPDPTGGKKASFWFYERARGQYEVEKSKHLTPAARRTFKEKYPPEKRFDKLTLAKSIMTWDFQEPSLVSLGGQKNFSKFSGKLAMGAVPKNPDRRFFKELACKVKLFRTMDEIVRTTQDSGYKANVITYTLAWFSVAVKGRLPYGHIWKTQEIPSEMKHAIERMGQEVRKHLVATNGTPTANVTEWAKDPDCWKQLQNMVVPIDDGDRLKYEHLLSSDQGVPAEAETPETGLASDLEREVMAIPVATWSRLRQWPQLDSKSKTIIGLALRSVKLGRAPRPEFRSAALAIYRQAVGYGFKP